MHEFQLAARDPARECVCQSMIGYIALQQGDVDGAINAFIRGLGASARNQNTLGAGHGGDPLG